MNNIRKICALFLMLPFFVTGNTVGQEFNAKEMVLEHIGDSYSWHITKWGDKDVFIALPVIIKSKESGWHLFLSSRLEHGAGYRGLHIAREGKYAGKIVERGHTGEEIRPVLDISITKNVAALLINCMVVLLVIMPLAGWYRRGTMKPTKGFKGAIEILLVNIEEVIKECVGEDYKRFSPFLLTVFFFIFVNNLMGLIPFFPGGANVTGNIAITMVLALCTFLAVNISGKKAYWKEIFWPEIPIWLKAPAPIMPALEFLGIFTKPFALMIRLFANMLAGHAVILGLLCLIFISATMGTVINVGMSAISIVFTCFMFLLELLVAFLQAYIFTLLSSVFIGIAVAKHPEHANKHKLY